MIQRHRFTESNKAQQLLFQSVMKLLGCMPKSTSEYTQPGFDLCVGLGLVDGECCGYISLVGFIHNSDI